MNKFFNWLCDCGKLLKYVIARDVCENCGFVIPAMYESLKKEFKYYLENQEDLVKEYDGKYIVIKNLTVIGEYNDELTAIRETSETHELGTFLVQKCEPDEDNYTEYIY